MSKDITLGILGSGQLGTELVRSAKKIGISKIIVLSDDKDGPAQNFCDEYIYSDYKDISNLKKFINKIDICTYEFENLPIEILNKINQSKNVYPNPNCLRIAQNRLLEKSFANELGIKSTEWQTVKSIEELKKIAIYFQVYLKQILWVMMVKVSTELIQLKTLMKNLILARDIFLKNL